MNVAETEGTWNNSGCADLTQARIHLDCRVCVYVYLTGLGVFQDPVQQLLLWQVAELSDDGPLGLEVGHALYRHESQEYKNCSLVF